MHPRILPLLLFACASFSWAAAPQQEVSWRGTLRQVVRGDTDGRIDLKELDGKEGLYAVGPAAGLDGEVTVLDGKPHVAQVRKGEIVTTHAFSGSAAFLIWSQVRGWQSTDPLLMEAENHKQLARVIRKMARTFGIDVDRPFPFLLQGKVRSLDYHVVVPPGNGDPADRSHRHPALHLKAADERVTIIGFYARDHEGILTHRGSHLHMHVVTDRGLSGHIDDISATPDLFVRFPK